MSEKAAGAEEVHYPGRRVGGGRDRVSWRVPAAGRQVAGEDRRVQWTISGMAWHMRPYGFSRRLRSPDSQSRICPPSPRSIQLPRPFPFVFSPPALSTWAPPPPHCSKSPASSAAAPPYRRKDQAGQHPLRHPLPYAALVHCAGSVSPPHISTRPVFLGPAIFPKLPIAGLLLSVALHRLGATQLLENSPSTRRYIVDGRWT